MKTSTLLSILLATVAVASPAPEPVEDAPHVEVTAKPDAHEVHNALAAAACKPNKTCLSEASKVPKCAVSCIESAASKVKCDGGAANLNCQCKSSSTIQNLAADCVISKCGTTTGLSVLGAVSSVCECNSKHPYSHCASQTKDKDDHKSDDHKSHKSDDHKSHKSDDHKSHKSDDHKSHKSDDSATMAATAT